MSASSGYATASLDDGELVTGADGAGRVSLTARLGCTETTVAAVRLRDGDALDLPAAPEQLCLPVEGRGSLRLDGAVGVAHGGVGRVPAGAGCRVRATGAVGLFVVGAPADPAASTAPTAVTLAACEFAPPETSAIDTARLTARLGCAGTKVNARRLGPGDAVPYHTEGTQEELFVPVSGPAAMRVGGETYATPPGTVTRVAPQVPRSAVDGGDGSLWVVVGAPPTGGPTEWDPGAEILE